MKKGLAPICVVVMLSACGLFGKDKPPPPPEPTRIVLELEAAGDINPNSQGRPSPLVLRIYQLTSYSKFEDADFFSLYQKANEVLSGDLENQEEILLKPNEKRTVFYEVSDDIKTIGLLGIFRDYDKGQWKAATGVQQNKTNVVNVYISGTKLTIK